MREIAKAQPGSLDDLRGVSGVGEKKLREFGAAFLAEIASHLQTHPRQIFAEDSFGPAGTIPARARLGDTVRETLRRFRAGASVEQIATQRLLATSTVYGHLADAILAGEEVDVNQFLTPEEQREIASAFGKSGFATLSPVFASLGGRFDYGQLKLVRAALTRQSSAAARG